MNHDQNFKNLILDYPRAALEFFAREESATIPAEQAQYEQYLQQSSYKEAIMGPIQQAIEKGIQQGIQQGREKGLQEGGYKKAVEMAGTLFGKGIDIGVIAESSGLSEEEIRKLTAHWQTG